MTITYLLSTLTGRGSAVRGAVSAPSFSGLENPPEYKPTSDGYTIALAWLVIVVCGMALGVAWATVELLVRIA
jgi:hypothetical protein